MTKFLPVVGGTTKCMPFPDISHNILPLSLAPSILPICQAELEDPANIRHL